MNTELSVLALTAASIGFLHTLLGPDHYLPFIMISWARKWSLKKTFVITLLCGVGHIVGSIVLGLIGIFAGLAIKNLEITESYRGDIAGWLLMGFGLAYCVWGMKQSIRKKPHSHGHLHIDGDDHEHTHSHQDGHLHIHDSGGKGKITPWVLFIIFAFGPCEPLIPILMYPAAKSNLWGVGFVTAVFGITTVATMLSVVIFGAMSKNVIRFKPIERYSHAIAGAAILLCGVAIRFLGL